ncbi:hypothetical protein DFQ30_010425 [Apophysomyces sp. BC1015]|nr:hypothetical protein DFQ30_010425 [Apophysomyces sp. BC1015]
MSSDDEFRDARKVFGPRDHESNNQAVYYKDVLDTTAEDDDQNSLIDWATFDQLLEMDEEDNHDFSHSIVSNYYENTELMNNKDLSELLRLGYNLKGSSAALGLIKVKGTCERIQNIGNRQDEDEQLSESAALERIAPLLPRVKKEYSEAKEYLTSFYGDDE